jgi:hypothetical protein
MEKKATMVFEIDEDRDVVEVQIQIFDQDCIGRDATFVLNQRVRVKDHDPVHESKKLYLHEFRTDHRTITFTIPTREFTGFCYDGSEIEIEYQGVLKIDDAVFFDTKVTEKVTYKLFKKPKIRIDTDRLIEPKDHFNFVTNLRAIPIRNQLATLVLVFVGMIVITVNMGIGCHDQLSPESQTFLYSHRGSDGDSSSPFMKSLVGSGAAGAAIWFAIRRQLRKYMKFRFKQVPNRIDRTTRVPIEQLIHGVARVELKDVTLRVVACNLEKGQYMRGSGSDRRTVSFSEPIQGVLLYEQKARSIPPKQPVENSFEGMVEFGPMFDALYPPAEVSSSHGLFVYWEVQLLLDKFIDQELAGSTSGLLEEDFFSDGS